MKFSHHLFHLIIFLFIGINGSAQKLVPCNSIDPQTKEKKWGFCDCFYTDVVIKCQYDTTFTFTEGLGRVRQNGKYGFVDKTGKLVIPAKYELADAFSEGFAMVLLDGKISFIDKKGLDLFKKTFKKAAPFRDGMAMVSNDEDKVGFIDTQGNLAIPFTYKWGHPFNKGMAPVLSTDGKTWTAINKKGETIFTLNDKVKNALGSFNDGLVMVTVNSPNNNLNFDFVNEKGEFICDAPYVSAQPFKNGRAIIAYENKNRSGGLQFYKYGLIAKGGREIVRAQYACLEESPIPGIYFYGSTSASISNCNGYGLLDSNGKELTQPKYSSFTRLNDTTFLCKEADKAIGNRFLILTTKGKELLNLPKEKIEFNIAGNDTLLLLWSKTFNGGLLISVYHTQNGLLKDDVSGVSVFEKQKLLLIPEWKYASGSLMTTDGKIIMDKIQTHEFIRDTSIKGDIPFILVSADMIKDFKMYNLNTRKIMVNDYGFKSKGNPYYSGQFTEGLLPVRVKEKYGYIDTSGKLKLPALYESADIFHNGWAVVGKKGKGEDESYEVYINKAGKEMPGVKAGYLHASDFSEGFAFFQKPHDYNKDNNDESIYYINTSGKVIFKSESHEFIDHGDFSNGMAAVPNKDGKYGYINTKGELIIPYQFAIPDKKGYANSIAFDDYGQALVEKDGKKIVIDKTGKQLK
jgi:hypothetical protein